MEGEDRKGICTARPSNPFTVALRMEGEDRKARAVSRSVPMPVALRMEGEDRKQGKNGPLRLSLVALRMEGEDRKDDETIKALKKLASPSVWRARIERTAIIAERPEGSVALRMEGEDRKISRWTRSAAPWGRPPDGGRG